MNLTTWEFADVTIRLSDLGLPGVTRPGFCPGGSSYDPSPSMHASCGIR